MPKTAKHQLNLQASLHNSQYTTTGQEGGITPFGGLKQKLNDTRQQSLAFNLSPSLEEHT